jgi:Flp pilus assembly protein TadB
MILALLGAFALALIFLSAFASREGRKGAERDFLERLVNSKDAQLKAKHTRPRNRRSLIKRLFGGDF